jgi:hypothetical protein
VTLAADMPKRRAAAEKPWSWATAAKTCISWKRSIDELLSTEIPQAK